MVGEKLTQIDQENATAYALRTSDTVQAIALATEAMRLSEKSNYLRGVGCALRTLAIAKMAGNLTEAYQKSVRAIEILVEEGDFFEASTAYPVLFIYYANTGQQQLAEAAIKRGIELADLGNNHFAKALGSYNYGFFLREEGRLDEARLHLEVAAKVSLKASLFPTYGLAMAELARLFALKATSSFDYSTLVGVLDEVSSMPGGLGTTELRRAQGLYLDAVGEFDSAVIAYRKARIHAAQTKNWREYLRVCRTRAEQFVLRGNYSKARRTILGELRVLRREKLLIGESAALHQLAVVERNLGLFEEATDHLLEHLAVKQELQCLDAEARYRELEVVHRTEQFSEQAKSAKRQAEALSEMNQQLHHALERQTELQKELIRIASTDELTGAVNRRQIVNDGILEMERYRHTGAPFAITVIDVDHFKSINDTFGHATGDEVLRRLTKCCQALLRKFDVFGRLGGEEFCIIHHDSDLYGAQMAVKRVMDAVEKMFTADILPDRNFSVSIGVAEVHESDATFYDVLHHADLALFEAKRSGRNTYRMAMSRTLEAA